MASLIELSNNPAFCREVENKAHELYQHIRQMGIKEPDIAKCWVLVVDAMLKRQDIESLRDYPNNIVKLRGDK
jgi:hypothetical protein